MEIIKTKSGELHFKEKVRLSNGRLMTQTFRRKTDAVSWKRKIETEKTQGMLGVHSVKPIPFETLAEKWFELKIKHTHAFKTVESYQSSMRIHAIAAFRGLNVDQITSSHIEDLKGAMLRHGFKSKSINRVLTIIRQILIYAQDEGHLKELPMKRTLLLKHEKKTFDYFEDSEIKALLRSNHDSPIYPILYLALHTGMRRGEILGLCWDRVNFASGKIEITRTLLSRRVLQEKTKGGKARYFPLNDELRKFFLELRRRQMNERFVFTDENGESFNPNHFCGRNFAKACERAGVRKLRFHDLRHSFASHFAMRGGSVFELKELLGHTDIKTTMIYAHLSPNHLEQASRIVNFGEFLSEEGTAVPLLALAVGSD